MPAGMGNSSAGSRYSKAFPRERECGTVASDAEAGGERETPTGNRACWEPPHRARGPGRISSFAIKGGGANIDARLSPDGKYLLVNGSGPHFVSVFAVNGGNLTEVPSSPTPLPAGATSSSGIVNT